MSHSKISSAVTISLSVYIYAHRFGELNLQVEVVALSSFEEKEEQFKEQVCVFLGAFVKHICSLVVYIYFYHIWLSWICCSQ